MPSSITYSSVVSRDSVRIAFLVAALNDLDVMSADIDNAYLNAPIKERIWTVAGPEFGTEQGAVFIITRALCGLKSAGAAWRSFFAQALTQLDFRPTRYLNAPNKERIWTVAGPEFGTEQGAVFIITRALCGLKSAGAAWRSFFAQALTQLDFRPTRGNGDVYIKPQTKPNGTKYYEMLLVYIDDILVLSNDTKPILDGIAAQFRLKADSLRAPDQYVGATIKIFTDCEGSESWAMSSDEYVRAALNKIVEGLDKRGLKLKGRAFQPFDSSYCPELDVTEELDDAGVAKFQGYIGTFRWMIELGRLDILMEVSQLSSFQAMPRKGHLEACYSIFAYLRKHPNMAIISTHQG